MKDPTNIFQPGGVYLIIGLAEVKMTATEIPWTVVIDGFGGPWMTPGNIRNRVQEYRQVAQERSLVILLITTSPIVMNCFGHDDYENVLVGGTPLLDLHTKEWLAQAKLGSLYEREQLEADDA